MRVRYLVAVIVAMVSLTAAACDSHSPTDEISVAPAGANDSSLPDSVRAALREDAARLALREVQQSGKPADQPVDIPAALTTTFYRALVGVYNLSGGAADTVARLYAIHTSGNPSVNDLLVFVDTAAAWAAPWRGKQALTGVAAIDSLVRHYQLSIASVTRLSGLNMGDMFDVRSAGQYNMLALAQRFQATGLIRSAEPNSWIGGSRDITAVRQSAGWRLDYRVGWGDCPAGCINGHIWSFLAFDTGGVRYVGSSGPAVPERPY